MPIINSRLSEQVVCYHAELINIYNASIGAHTKIGDFTEIGGSDIGDNCVISAYVFIPPGCRVGNDVFIGPKTALLNDLQPSIKGADFIPNGVTIEDGAILGACCTILPGVTIGKNARVAAGALVTRDVPENTTVLGFPARPRDDVWVPPKVVPVPYPASKEEARPERKPSERPLDTMWDPNKDVYGPGSRTYVQASSKSSIEPKVEVADDDNLSEMTLADCLRNNTEEENSILDKIIKRELTVQELIDGVGNIRKSAVMPEGWEATLNEMEDTTDRIIDKLKDKK